MTRFNAETLTADDVSVRRDDDTLVVHGRTTDEIGQLAADQGVTLYELSARQASLEDAYLKLTDDAVDYRAGGA